jgi:hypothetical protein
MTMSHTSPVSDPSARPSPACPDGAAAVGIALERLEAILPALVHDLGVRDLAPALDAARSSVAGRLLALTTMAEQARARVGSDASVGPASPA